MMLLRRTLPDCQWDSLGENLGHSLNVISAFWQTETNKVKSFSNTSTRNDHRKEGTIGEKENISRLWNCSYDYLRDIIIGTIDNETGDRIELHRSSREYGDNQILANIWFIGTVWSNWGNLHIIKHRRTMIMKLWYPYAYCLKDNQVSFLRHIEYCSDAMPASVFGIFSICS